MSNFTVEFLTILWKKPACASKEVGLKRKSTEVPIRAECLTRGRWFSGVHACLASMEVWVWILSIHLKQRVAVYVCKLSTRDRELESLEDSWSLLASQIPEKFKLQVHWEILSQENKTESDWRSHPTWPLTSGRAELCSRMYTHTHACYTHTHTHAQKNSKSHIKKCCLYHRGIRLT